MPEIRNLLGAFNFRGDEIEKTMSSLSGGERARVALLKLILRKPNFLIMDEPTNHLDASSREVLEQALQNYEGTILCVSHDRYFVNKLASRILSFSGEEITVTDGNYDDYINMLKARKGESAPLEAPKKPNEYLLKKEALRSERKRQTRLSKIERRLKEIEDEKNAVSGELASPGTASEYEKLIKLTEKLQELSNEQAELENEWLELSE